MPFPFHSQAHTGQSSADETFQAEIDQNITQEQIRDAYTAGTSDGILEHEEGIVHVSREGQVTEVDRHY